MALQDPKNATADLEAWHQNTATTTLHSNWLEMLTRIKSDSGLPPSVQKTQIMSSLAGDVIWGQIQDSSKQVVEPQYQYQAKMPVWLSVEIFHVFMASNKKKQHNVPCTPFVLPEIVE